MMRTAFALALLATQLVARNTRAQRLDRVGVFGPKKGPAMLVSEPTPRSVLLILLTVPVSSSKLETDSTGAWRMGANMALGGGATLILGKARDGEKGAANVTPWLLLGVAANFGVGEDPNRTVAGSTFVSAFVGAGSLAVAYQYDPFRRQTFYGLSMKLDIITDLKPDAYLRLWHCG